MIEISDDLSTWRGNIAANFKKWNSDHKWPEHGDEWKGQAVACNIPYPEWKRSLIETLIAPNVSPGMHALEIAPGHGRWTEALVARAASVSVVDLSPACLDHCRGLFTDKNVDYFLTDGSSLPNSVSGRIDFVWSFDAFVHMAPEVIAEYFLEIARVLKGGGKAVIHHADIDDLRSHKQKDHEGWRSGVDIGLVRGYAEKANLDVISQFTYWNEELRIGVPRFGDKITMLKKCERISALGTREPRPL